jgi:hypothetical protein
MRDDPPCLGGTYFTWIAPGAGDPWGWMRWGEDADWGILNADLTPKPAFWGMRVLYSPVRLPARLTWHEGQTELELTVQNGFNSIDLSECTLRTQMGGGPPYMSMLREWRDVPMQCPPGETGKVTVPLWREATRKTLATGKPAVCRCTVQGPDGARVIMADVLVVPESLQGEETT